MKIRINPKSNPDFLFKKGNPNIYKLHATDLLRVVGVYSNSNRILAANTTQNTLIQKYDYNATWGTDKGLPTNVTASNVMKIIEFKNNLYLLGKDSSDGAWKIWSSPLKTVDNASFVWSEPLHTLVSGGTGALPAVFNDDASYLYCGAYGDPLGGAIIYRSSDGVNWTTSFGPDPENRHIHGVNPDPYNPGHVWAVIGDGGTKLVIYSTDYGANWNALSNAWQGCQISFTKDYVWIACDAQINTVFVVDKSTRIAYKAAKNHHSKISVPGGAVGDKFYKNAFMGAVSPKFETYYSIATDVGGNTKGLFFLPALGENLSLLDTFESTYNPEVFVVDNINSEFVYFGNYAVYQYTK